MFDATAKASKGVPVADLIKLWIGRVYMIDSASKGVPLRILFSFFGLEEYQEYA